MNQHSESDRTGDVQDDEASTQNGGIPVDASDATEAGDSEATGGSLRQYRLYAVRVVATSTTRVASNADAFLPRLEEASGYPIGGISGEE